jgi:histidinol-phosphate aminotransferase
MAEMRAVLSGDGALLDLANNESPIEPSPMITRAIFQGAFETNRFPDDEALQLCRVIARKHSVMAPQVVVGPGVHALLEFVASIALNEGGEVVTGFPASPAYERAALRAGGTILRVQLHNWRNDLKAIAARVTVRTRLVMLGNPNDPTGTTVRGDDLARFIESLPHHLLVVVDESFAEYITHESYHSAVGFLDAHPGLVVLRSFSYAYGLAGLRIGYAIASNELAAHLGNQRGQFATGRIAQAAAIAALEDEGQLEKVLWTNRLARQLLCERLDGMGLGYVPSQTNFVLVRVIDAQEVADALLEKGIRVRTLQSLGLRDYLRITTGTVEEMHRVADQLQVICTGDAMRLASRMHTAHAAVSQHRD